MLFFFLHMAKFYNEILWLTIIVYHAIAAGFKFWFKFKKWTSVIVEIWKVLVIKIF